MAMLMAFDYLLSSGILKLSGNAGYIVALVEVVVFLLPVFLLVGISKKAEQPVNLRLGGFTRKAIPFVIFMSLLASVASFLLNCIEVAIFNLPSYQTGGYASSMMSSSGLVLFIAIALMPAICEEFMFRGGILGAFEKKGTVAAILVSAVSFALVHGNIRNFLGLLLAGAIYAYLVYTLKSIWPAVIAHLLNNVYYIVISYISEAYEAVGIWMYFVVINVLALCVFLFLAMRSLEKLINQDKIERFNKTSMASYGSVLVTPGIWLLVILFVIKGLYF